MKPNAILLIALLFTSCSKNKTTEPEPEKPDNAIAVTTFTPSSAVAGQVVTIKGKGFGTDINKVKVQFADGAVIAPKTVANEELTVEVPATATTGQIAVTVGSNAPIKTFDTFTVYPTQPSFLSMAPLTGAAGEEVTITGANFGTDASKIKVSFANGTTAYIKSVTPTKIVVLVTASGVTGALTISMTGTNPVNTPVFTMILPDSYVIKTVGFSWMNIGLDNSNKLTIAEFFGGGNRVIIKSGTGNSITANINTSTLPNAFYPGGYAIIYGNGLPIDNGVPIASISEEATTNIKIKGFDKAKTGYNELRLVMQKFVYSRESGWAGFEMNYNFLTVNKTGKNNTDFGSGFFKTLLSGDIKVEAVEIAKPKSENRYIVRDEYISFASPLYNVKQNKTTDIDMSSYFWRGLFTNESKNPPMAVGGSLKSEWVNANSGTVVKLDDYTYEARFNNIKRGGRDQVILPADSVDKVFLRITGFDPEKCGYNALRLFITDDGERGEQVRMDFSAKPDFVPSLSFIKDQFSVGGMGCYHLGPLFPSY